MQALSAFSSWRMPSQPSAQTHDPQTRPVRPRPPFRAELRAGNGPAHGSRHGCAAGSGKPACRALADPAGRHAGGLWPDSLDRRQLGTVEPQHALRPAGRIAAGKQCRCLGAGSPAGRWRGAGPGGVGHAGRPAGLLRADLSDWRRSMAAVCALDRAGPAAVPRPAQPGAVDAVEPDCQHGNQPVGLGATGALGGCRNTADDDAAAAGTGRQCAGQHGAASGVARLDRQRPAGPPCGRFLDRAADRQPVTDAVPVAHGAGRGPAARPGPAGGGRGLVWHAAPFRRFHPECGHPGCAGLAVRPGRREAAGAWIFRSV